MLPNKRRKRQCFGVAKVVSLPSAESSSSTHSLPRGTPAPLAVPAPELGRPTLRKGKVVSGNVATPPRLPQTHIWNDSDTRWSRRRRSFFPAHRPPSGNG